MSTIFPKVTAGVRNKINKKITELTRNTYFDAIPVDKIAAILREFNLNTDCLDGIYCGRQGEMNEQIQIGLWIRLSWYKMESGRYEIVCYVS